MGTGGFKFFWGGGGGRLTSAADGERAANGLNHKNVGSIERRSPRFGSAAMFPTDLPALVQGGRLDLPRASVSRARRASGTVVGRRRPGKLELELETGPAPAWLAVDVNDAVVDSSEGSSSDRLHLPAMDRPADRDAARAGSTAARTRFHRRRAACGVRAGSSGTRRGSRQAGRLQQKLVKRRIEPPRYRRRADPAWGWPWMHPDVEAAAADDRRRPGGRRGRPLDVEQHHRHVFFVSLTGRITAVRASRRERSGRGPGMAHGPLL